MRVDGEGAISVNGHGIYQVVGRRPYRGHQPGEVFEATLDQGAEERAIARGDILLLERVIPGLQPGSYTLPDGWRTHNTHTTGALTQGPSDERGQ